MRVINTSEAARRELIDGLFGTSTPPADAEMAVNNFEQRLGISFKKKIISAVTIIFIVSVAVLWTGIGWVAYTDYIFLSSKIITASDRVVNEKVLLALIAGTVAQVSISFGLLMKYMFSNTQDDVNPTSDSKTS